MYAYGIEETFDIVKSFCKLLIIDHFSLPVTLFRPLRMASLNYNIPNEKVEKILALEFEIDMIREVAKHIECPDCPE